jgi:hypothetical protein
VLADEREGSLRRVQTIRAVQYAGVFHCLVMVVFIKSTLQSVRSMRSYISLELPWRFESASDKITQHGSEDARLRRAKLSANVLVLYILLRLE